MMKVTSRLILMVLMAAMSLGGTFTCSYHSNDHNNPPPTPKQSR